MSSNDNFKEILKTAAGQLEIAVDDEKQMCIRDRGCVVLSDFGSFS